MTVKDGKIDFIQMLRGIAAVSVTIFHARGHLPSQSPFSQWLFSAASSGVDIFFMISGFIMVYTTRNSNGSFLYFSKFMLKRFARIWPMYLVLTFLYIILMLLSAFIINRVDVDPSVTDILKSLFFIPLILDKSDGPFWGGSVLHTGWTLNFEMYFYSFFAISLLFGRYKWLLFFSWVIFTLILLPSMAGNISLDPKHYYGWDWGYLNLITSPLIWEFVVGVIIGLIYFSKLRIKNTKICWLLCLLALSFTMWYFLGGINPGFGIVNWGLPYVILFSILVISSKSIEIKSPYFLVWLGNISFSLYLIHPLVIHPLANIAWEFESLRNSLQDMSYIIFLTVLSICFAAVAHEFLEKRLSNWFRDKLFTLLKIKSEGRKDVSSN